MSIKRRIIIFVMLLSILGGSFLIAFNQVTLENSLLSSQEEYVQASVKLGYQQIDNIMSRMEMTARNLSLFATELYELKQQHPTLEANSIVKEHLVNVFSRTKESIGGGIWFEPFTFKSEERWYGPYVFRENSTINFTWDLSQATYDYHNHDWYKNAFRTMQVNDENIYWSQPYLDEAGTMAMMITVSAPILDRAGKKVGVTTVDLAINSLSKMVEQVEFTENSSSYLIDKSSALFLSFPHSAMSHMKNVSTQPWGHAVQTKAVNHKVSRLVDVSYDNQQGAVYFILTKANLVLGVFMPDIDYMRYIDEIIKNNLIFSLLFSLVFLIGMVLILDRVFAPLQCILDDIRLSITNNKRTGKLKVTALAEPSINEFKPIIKALNIVYEKITEYTVQIEQVNDELKHKQQVITELNVNLEEKVQERTRDLEAKTSEVINVLNELKSTQAQMISMEKNAALGQLVVGIAHEINTPVGICITANSTLKDRYLVFKTCSDANRVSRAGLFAFLKDVVETTDILQSNLIRTNELIENFKKVAADQSEDEMRLFSLKEYTELVFAALSPKFIEDNIKFTIDIAEEIQLYSYPGIFSQIFNNLILNSCLHAFTGQVSKQITVSAEINEFTNSVLIIFSDNGQGIEDSFHDKVFEPFFTTSRDKGGTGLGLHIIYNLITHKLNGSIKIKCGQDVGTKFLIEIPLIETK